MHPRCLCSAAPLAARSLRISGQLTPCRCPVIASGSRQPVPPQRQRVTVCQPARPRRATSFAQSRSRTKKGSFSQPPTRLDFFRDRADSVRRWRADWEFCPGSLMALGACPSHSMGRAHGACEVRLRREEEGDAGGIVDDEQRRARPQPPCALRVPAGAGTRPML